MRSFTFGERAERSAVSRSLGISPRGSHALTQRSKLGSEDFQPSGLDGVGNVPLVNVGAGAVEQRQNAGPLLRRQRCLRAHTGQRGFTRGKPVVDQLGVMNQKGCHPKTGGIANAQMTLDHAVQRNSPRAATGLRDVFNQIVGKVPDQPDCQHLSGERPAKSGTVGENKAIGDAEFAVTVNGSCPHQVADGIHQRDIRLLTPGKSISDVREGRTDLFERLMTSSRSE